MIFAELKLTFWIFSSNVSEFYILESYPSHTIHVNVSLFGEMFVSKTSLIMYTSGRILNRIKNLLNADYI
jgi:hypothetical protein